METGRIVRPLLWVELKGGSVTSGLHRFATAAVASLAATVLAAGAALADAPYPRSGLVAGLAWDRGSYRSAGDGGHLVPGPPPAAGRLYTAWGDGAVRCGAKVSYGVATLQGGPNANLQGAGCGPLGQGEGQMSPLLAVGDTLYAVVNLQDRPWPGPSFQVWRSADRG